MILMMACSGIYLLLNVTIHLRMRPLQAFGRLSRRTDIGLRSLIFNRRYLEAEPLAVT